MSLRSKVQSLFDRIRPDCEVAPWVHEELRAILAQAGEPVAWEGEAVAAQWRFRHPQKTTPDWSPWQQCDVKKHPAWEIDSQGYEVEYRLLYTAPPDTIPRAEYERVVEELRTAFQKHADDGADLDAARAEVAKLRDSIDALVGEVRDLIGLVEGARGRTFTVAERAELQVRASNLADIINRGWAKA